MSGTDDDDDYNVDDYVLLWIMMMRMMTMMIAVCACVFVSLDNGLCAVRNGDFVQRLEDCPQYLLCRRRSGQG
jgi:hypothetical protein